MKKRDVDRMIRRARDMLAVVTEHAGGEIEEVCAGVICNGCGESVIVRAPTKDALFSSLPLALDGWTITEKPEDADLCPACSKRAAA